MEMTTLVTVDGTGEAVKALLIPLNTLPIPDTDDVADEALPISIIDADIATVEPPWFMALLNG
jgi:hypothetical protein